MGATWRHGWRHGMATWRHGWRHGMATWNGDMATWDEGRHGDTPQKAAAICVAGTLSLVRRPGETTLDLLAEPEIFPRL